VELPTIPAWGCCVIALCAPGPLGCWQLVLVWLLFSYFLAMGIFLFALKIKKAQKK
jgi:hypothetical protein